MKLFTWRKQGSSTDFAPGEEGPSAGCVGPRGAERSPWAEAMSQKANPKSSQERRKEREKTTNIQRQRMSTQVVKRSVTLQRPSLPTKRLRGRRRRRWLGGEGEGEAESQPGEGEQSPPIPSNPLSPEHPPLSPPPPPPPPTAPIASPLLPLPFPCTASALPFRVGRGLAGVIAGLTDPPPPPTSPARTVHHCAEASLHTCRSHGYGVTRSKIWDNGCSIQGHAVSGWYMGQPGYQDSAGLSLGKGLKRPI
ncbi:hypothetical protein JZ751_008289 [Albula glossodonta]|uniref:Uncharacterized protein n=1 Tax=Albula glossodonta TaxID=121402 RepID=A0A8T2NCV2_9TELE|nr:hypothetical protein JZ751_008289 [Albula glossodonta]